MVCVASVLQTFSTPVPQPNMSLSPFYNVIQIPSVLLEFFWVINN